MRNFVFDACRVCFKKHYIINVHLLHFTLWFIFDFGNSNSDSLFFVCAHFWQAVRLIILSGDHNWSHKTIDVLIQLSYYNIHQIALVIQKVPVILLSYASYGFSGVVFSEVKEGIMTTIHVALDSCCESLTYCRLVLFFS